MSRILRRPMFRGGPVSSYGNGIASGLADGGMPDKRGFVDGPGGYAGKAITGADLIKANTMNDMDKKRFLVGKYGKNTTSGILFPDSPTGVIRSLETADLYNTTGVGPTGKDRMSNAIDQSMSKLFDTTGGKYQAEDEGDVDFDMNFAIADKTDNSDIEESISEAEEFKKTDDERLLTILENARVNQYNLSPEEREKIRVAKNKAEVGGRDLNFQQRGMSEEDYAESIPGVIESNTDDGTEMGFQSMAEKADAFYESLTTGAEDRAAKRLALEEAKAKEKISRARKTDAFNTMLKFFEGSQKEGATVGSSAAEASQYLTSKPSATELAMDKRDARELALADRAFALDEKRRDTAGQMAFKDYMQQEAFDFSDVKSTKDFNRKMAMLEKKLKSAETIAEKNIIAQAIRDGKKQWAPGSLEKDLVTLGSLTGSKRREALALKGYPLDIVSYLREKQNLGSKVTGEGILGAVEFYYGPEFQGMIGMEDELKDKEPGVYLKSDMSKLVIIDADGNSRIQSLII